MAQFNNSFALLDDEEGDDVASLVSRIVKKVDNSLMHAQNETESSEFVKEESGHRRGGQGRRDGNRGNGHGGRNGVRGGHARNGLGRNCSRDSYGSGDVIKEGEQLVGDDGWNYLNEAAGDDKFQSVNGGIGLQDVSESGGRRDDNYDRSFEVGHRRSRYGNGRYSGERNGFGDGIQHNDAADGRRRFRNGRSYDGKRRGYGDQTQGRDAADGHHGYRNDNGGYDGERRANGDQVQDSDAADGQRRFRNRNWSRDGERRGKGDQVRGNDAADRQWRYRNGNQTYEGKRIGRGDQPQNNAAADYEGKRIGHGDQPQNNAAGDGHGNRFYDGERERRSIRDRVQNNDAAYGQRRYRSGRQSFGGERTYHGDQIQDCNGGSEMLNVKGEASEDNKVRGEERTYRNGNRNFVDGKRGYGGFRGKGRQEYQTSTGGEVEVDTTSNVAGGLDVKAEHKNINESDAAVVLEDSEAVETENKNTSEEFHGDIKEPKEAEAQKRQEESELKKKQFEESKQKKEEEEDKEAKLMTLDEYEKLLLEKRQALESRKTAERRVAIDKIFEGMRLVVKKQDDTDDKQKSEKKLQKKGSLEKKENGRNVVAHELFKRGFHRRNNGDGGCGHRDQGGLNDQKKYYNGPRTNGDASRAQHQRRPLAVSVPTDKDFPVLSANAVASAAVKV